MFKQDVKSVFGRFSDEKPVVCHHADRFFRRLHEASEAMMGRPDLEFRGGGTRNVCHYHIDPFYRQHSWREGRRRWRRPGGSPDRPPLVACTDMHAVRWLLDLNAFRLRTRIVAAVRLVVPALHFCCIRSLTSSIKTGTGTLHTFGGRSQQQKSHTLRNPCFVIESHHAIAE